LRHRCLKAEVAQDHDDTQRTLNVSCRLDLWRWFDGQAHAVAGEYRSDRHTIYIS
jgi:hypothetical protein